jgi:hypothetical protein
LEFHLGWFCEIPCNEGHNMFDMWHGKKVRNCMSLMLDQKTFGIILNMKNKNCRSLHIHFTKEVLGTREVEPKLMMTKSWSLDEEGNSNVCGSHIDTMFKYHKIRTTTSLYSLVPYMRS